MKYKLSVIIPTKNRQLYCLQAIQQILSLNIDSLEIVIQDNSDNNSLYEEVLKFNVNNILYNYNSSELSFVDNFSEAISISSGDYLLMIGDDDGLLPNVSEILEFAIDNNYDCVIPGLNAVYIWPNSNSIVKNGENGYLCISYLKEKKYDANVIDALNNLIKNGGQDYQSFDLPRLYHGIVKRSTIENVKNECNKYFGGLTPDIYMATVLTKFVKKALKLSYPITISGICPGSGSSNSATGAHTGDLKDAPHFKGHKNYVWDNKVPAFYSVETIWAETVLHALKDINFNDQYNSFNIKYLDAICLGKYPNYSTLINEHALCFKYSKTKLKFIYNKDKITKTFIKILKRITRTKFDVLKFYNVKDISQAQNIIVNCMRECKK